jgi:hypothetical protein
MRLAPTVSAALLTFVCILLAGTNFGVNRATVAFAIVCLCVFLLVALLLPFEMVEQKDIS